MTVMIQDGNWQTDSLPIEATLSACIVQFQELKEKQIAIVLSNDTQVQALNAKFRGQNKPTNVLSFPSDAEDEWGDLIFAYETIAREAAQQGKAFADHMAHLLIHGILHLLGYDHIDDSEAEEMEAIEIAILQQLAIANPYENP